MSGPASAGPSDAERLGPPPAPVIMCGTCAGAGTVTEVCRCGDGGNRLLVGWRDEVGRAYQDCQVCGGAGRVSLSCVDCGRSGRRRAQLVLTVADLDTGAVASANVVPGSVEPTPTERGGWCLDLTRLVNEQRATIGAGTPGEVLRERHRPWEAATLIVPLDRRWRPELPAQQRLALEAEAIARQVHRPWWLWLARSAAPPAELPEARLRRLCELADLPEARLRRLCELADLLRLDLVIEARRPHRGNPTWQVRYEVPGGEVPAQTSAYWPDLATAVAGTTVADALYGLGERGAAAPAYTMLPGGRRRAARPVVELARLGELIADDLARAPGAQAIWRDGSWWHVRLGVGGSTLMLTERDTGQVARQTVTLLRRAAEPPAPSWQGVPIPYEPCPDCVPGSRLVACYCRVDGGPAEPGCRLCGGAGHEPVPGGCPRCRGSHRRYAALTVTVTDLEQRAEHQLWLPGDGPEVGPDHRLDRPYRLADQAADFGVRPEDLTEADGGQPLTFGLREGLVLAGGPDPQRRFVASAAAGRPGARLIVVARRPDVPPLTDLVRLAHGLSLSALVGVCDDRPAGLGLRWVVSLGRDGLAPERVGRPHQLTVEAAIGHCLRFLDEAVRAAVPEEAGVPIPVPQAPATARPVDPVPGILALAEHHAGREVTVEIGRRVCRVHLREPVGWRLLARAATLTEALRGLGLPS
ncbi:hypothetical protein [Micromonospora endophytica]|uniref:hypothetical protein n=1 Tax=Micromonospora endophytica TaxID=515350 RepID=UPI0011B688DA|nr:hypothetical protein [Micromonospora endophytica]BCJ60354.1 hypothetical protein Jiend_37760 [Micromonospora endophytica]